MWWVLNILLADPWYFAWVIGTFCRTCSVPLRHSFPLLDVGFDDLISLHSLRNDFRLSSNRSIPSTRPNPSASAQHSSINCFNAFLAKTQFSARFSLWGLGSDCCVLNHWKHHLCPHLNGHLHLYWCNQIGHSPLPLALFVTDVFFVDWEQNCGTQTDGLHSLDSSLNGILQALFPGEV